MSTEVNREGKVSFSWLPFLSDVMYDPVARQPGRSLAPRALGVCVWGGWSSPDDSNYRGLRAPGTVLRAGPPLRTLQARSRLARRYSKDRAPIPFSNKDTEAQTDPAACPAGSRWQNQGPKPVLFDADFHRAFCALSALQVCSLCVEHPPKAGISSSEECLKESGLPLYPRQYLLNC